jgi:hypothetical protein
MPVRTRSEMEAIIARGESVLLHKANPEGGRAESVFVSRVEDLPSEAELAGADEARLQAEEDRILNEQAQLQAELRRVRRHRETVGQRAAKAAQPKAAEPEPPKAAAEAPGEKAPPTTSPARTPPPAAARPAPDKPGK